MNGLQNNILFYVIFSMHLFAFYAECTVCILKNCVIEVLLLIVFQCCDNVRACYFKDRCLCVAVFFCYV